MANRAAAKTDAANSSGNVNHRHRSPAPRSVDGPILGNAVNPPHISYNTPRSHRNPVAAGFLF